MEKIKEIEKLAIEAIRKSGNLVLNNLNKSKSVKFKGERDYITNSDIESEQIIIQTIKKNFPYHNFYSEESTIDNNSDSTWIIDPLCSTNNFVYGLPMFGIAVGLKYKSDIIFGTIYLPVFDWLFKATKGSGAYMNDKPINVSNKSELKDCLILYDNQFYKKKNIMFNYQKIVNAALTTRISGSAAFDMCMVAAGYADARIFNKTKDCDFVVGALIIEEAGGKVTDFSGNRWMLGKKQIIASNGKIHDQLIRVLSR